MKNQILKLSLLTFLSLFIFSCDEDTAEDIKSTLENSEKTKEELAEEKKAQEEKELANAEFFKGTTMIVNFNKKEFMDPEIIGLNDRENATYQWSVNGEQIGEATKGQYLFGWDNIKVELFEFCAKITTSDQLNEITICEKVRYSDADHENRLNPSFENYRFEKNEEGIFILKFDQKNTNCIEPEFILENRDGLDITVNAPITPLEEGFTYKWKVITKYLDNRSDIISENAANGDNIFSWGIGEGSTIFSLTVTSEKCPEGTTIVRSIIVPEGFAKKAQDAVGTKEVNVKEVTIGSGVYTVELIDNK